MKTNPNSLAFAALAAALLGGAAAAAGEVTLKSFDGSISVTGEFVSFDGTSYRIRSAIGEMTIDAFQVSCEGADCPAPEALQSQFTVAGARTLGAALLPALFEAYSFQVDGDMMMSTAENEATKLTLSDADGAALADVALNMRGSTAGIRDIATGDAVFAVTTRPILSSEAAEASAAGAGDLSQPGLENILALDGILIVTSPANPVRALSEQDAARIFSGQVTNWAEVGGLDSPINLYVPGEDTGTGFVFNNLVMQPAGVEMAGTATALESDAEVSDAVAGDPQGIGITSFSNERNAKAIAIRGVCGIQTPANAFTIKTEEYPLTRRLYLYRPDRTLPPVAQKFVDFVASDEAQRTIADLGFVDQGVSAQRVNEQGLRFVAAVLPTDAEVTLSQLQSMMRELIAADRLSITFRFEAGAASLDTRAEADVRRMAAMMARGEFDRKEVLLIGFTDSVGRADLNENLSRARAQQVLDALTAAAPPGSLDNITFTVQGYGEMSPLGCNETLNGRQINRRVEVWVRDRVG
jgi:phosphate transport system substrate-binding protein